MSASGSNKQQTRNNQEQEEYCNTIISTYENRNAELESEIKYLKHRIVDDMKLSWKDLEQSICNEEEHTPLKTPNLNNITESTFMDKLKELKDKEIDLMNDVRQLRNQGHDNTRRTIFKTINDTLLKENDRLSKELKDLKRFYSSNILKSPIYKELDKERRRVLLMETEMLYMVNEGYDTSSVKKEMELLKEQMNSCEGNLTASNDIDDELKNSIKALCQRVQDLQKDLINRKLSGIDDIKKSNSNVM